MAGGGIRSYGHATGKNGKEAADQAQDAAKAIFTSGSSSENMPTTAIPAADLQDGGMGILTLMVKAGLCASNGEARRLPCLVRGEKGKLFWFLLRCFLPIMVYWTERMQLIFSVCCLRWESFR